MGLARITVSAPRRRLDVALPDQAPVAELLPDLLRHAGGDGGEGTVGWVLRRVDGAALSPGRGLRIQGVRDGEVLHLVPAEQDWPELAYDDPAEAVAAAAGRRGARWTPAITGAAGLLVAVLPLAGGLALAVRHGPLVGPVAPAVVAGLLLLAAATACRRYRWRRAGVMLGASALPYAYAAGAAWAAGPLAAPAGATALLLASLGGYAAAGAGTPGRGLDGRFVFAAGATAGLLAVPAALAGHRWGAAAGAAVLACGLVCGTGVLPRAAVRLSRLPAAAATGGDVAFPVVARADELLTGGLAGWSVAAVAAVAILLVAGGPAGGALAAVTATALVLRSRWYAAVRHRLPLLAGGLAGYGLLLAVLVAAVPAGPAAVVLSALAGSGLLLAGAAGAGGPVPPYLGRVATVAETLAVVSVVPLAAAVLDLYARAQELVALAPPVPVPGPAG